MTPELTETIELIVAGLSLLITVVMIVCLWVLTKRNLKLKQTIRKRDERIKQLKGIVNDNWNVVLRQQKTIDEYRFVMRISDDISAEMQREIDTLKAKLNHKKRPQNANT